MNLHFKLFSQIKLCFNFQAGTIMTQDNQKLPDLGTNGVVKDILIMTFTIKNLSDSLQIEAAAREQAEKKLESCQSEKKFNVPKYENKTILEVISTKPNC